MEKKLSDEKLPAQTVGKGGAIVRFYSVVKEHTDVFEIGFTILAALLLFGVYPWFCMHEGASYLKLGMMLLVGVSSVLFFFLVIPCLFLKLPAKEKTEKEKDKSEQSSNDGGYSFGEVACCLLSQALYVISILHGVFWFFTEVGLKDVCTYMVVVWPILCFYVCYKILKKLGLI